MKQLLFLCLLSANMFSQNRENKINLKFETNSEKLTKAVGWKLNKETGKWVDNINVIEDKVCDKYWISYVSQNFKWIQISTVKHNGADFYVLLYEREGGEYKYASIRQDWQTNIQTHFLVLDLKEYKKLQDAVNDKKAKNIKISSKIFGSMSDKYKILGGEHLYNDENLLAKITTELGKSGYSETCFMINSQKTNNTDVVRFRLPESYCMQSAEIDMKESYFEVNFEEFTKILIK